MEPLNTLITLVKLTFGLGMDRDTRSLKQVEIVLSPPPEKGTDKYIDTIICCNGLRLRSALAYLISLGMAG